MQWVFPKIGGTPKMDGENHGKPYEQMDDLGGFPPIFGNIHFCTLGKGWLTSHNSWAEPPSSWGSPH